MNFSKKIKINENDQYFNIRLEQNIETLEIFSLKIKTDEFYRNFNSDYGVLIGRVIANEGIGIPNAKISIFLPIDDNDINNSQIFSLYPYKTPRDKNNEGKRYNLLPRVGKINSITNIVTPKQPFGSFPIKEEIVTNPTINEIYKKYYKYSTITNNNGDYMIFGVPIGIQTVHMSVDITDIGEYSMNPQTMINNLGYSPNLFTDGGTLIKETTDLDDLPHIETQEISVNIHPFWGDIENFEIGFTRQDFRIKSTLKPNFIVFGTLFTDAVKPTTENGSMWGGNISQPASDVEIRELYRLRDNVDHNIRMSNKDIGIITEKIYYYPPEISDEDIDNDELNLTDQMKVLNKSSYSVYKRDGDFVFVIDCNRKKVIKNESGFDLEIEYNSPFGIFTEFRGFITFELTPENKPLGFGETSFDPKLTPYRTRIKIPQKAPLGDTFRQETSNIDTVIDTNAWRKQSKKFKKNEFYSVAKFNALVCNPNINKTPVQANGFFQNDSINSGYEEYNDKRYFNVGIINTEDDLDLKSNIVGINNDKLFGANWLNFAIYLPHMGYTKSQYDELGYVRSNTNVAFTTTTLHMFEDNDQIIAGTEKNTKWFLRSDLHYTDFIKINKEDIIMLNKIDSKGFKLIENNINFTEGTEYRNGLSDCPLNGGKINGNPENLPDNDAYFYKGFGSADCIKYLFTLGLI